jgi:hypothetical protein
MTNYLFGAATTFIIVLTVQVLDNTSSLHSNLQHYVSLLIPM